MRDGALLKALSPLLSLIGKISNISSKPSKKNFDQEDKKISGYKAFADEVGLDVSYTKEIFSLDW